MAEPLRETALQMARRHVVEGRERLARREALVANMEAASSSRTGKLARELLEMMQAIVA